ncbi:HEXXH motif-containing putative peptide modification protein [Streptomyces sp. 1331.2]|uniref:HEXXH motif-containing putative peptide modification protein n=1 Tax=Streptomyces sp. 1331.2 TaxID=1938835 RepID=UPI000BC73BBB|nr:HEXXH motif-containing putative peptide modification protein [Streptomyces sp. 1331.2]SOB88672.1 HEXXH motif-containing protein [Streptomyces sp. 1331.2]
MGIKTILEYLTPDFHKGQQELAGVIRSLLFKSHPDIPESFDQGGDIFLEPLLFAYFTHPQRKAVWENSPGELLLRHEDAQDSALSKECPARLPFKITNASHPLLRRLFCEAGQVGELDGIATSKDLSSLENSWGLILRAYPEYAGLVEECVRRIVIFRASRPNSFAALSAHGAVFINASQGAGSIFFLEELLHQCGHVIFGAMTVRPERLFSVHPQTLLPGSNTPSGEPRTAYVVLHAIFTEMVMAEGFGRCLEMRLVEGDAQYELKGRLAYILQRYAEDLTDLLAQNIMSDAGLSLIEQLTEEFKRLASRHYEALRGVNLTGQPYVFDYSQFLRVNPLPGCSV